MDKLAITYTPHLDATPEAELAALCNVYRLLLDYALRNAAGHAGANSRIVRTTEEVSDVGRRPD